MLRMRDRIYKMMADYTGKTPEQIHRDFDRNKWLFAEEAIEYGCADLVLERVPEIVSAAGTTQEESDDESKQ
jgi:ATP-dependent protease ClpP protease subunit